MTWPHEMPGFDTTIAGSLPKPAWLAELLSQQALQRGPIARRVPAPEQASAPVGRRC